MIDKDLKEAVNGIGKLAKDNKTYGKDNTITAFFMIFVLVMTLWTQFTNNQRMDRMLEDNRIYNRELRADIDHIKESNTVIVMTNEKLITTNENLVKIIQTDLSNIKTVLKIGK
jgi:hypothetical protein